MPVHLALTPGEAQQSAVFGSPQRLPPQTMLLADRGYDARTGSGSLLAKKENGRTFRRNEIVKTRSASARILYRARNLIERFFNKIKQCRRVATRYDKLAANYLAFVKLASIRIWLPANESTS